MPRKKKSYKPKPSCKGGCKEFTFVTTDRGVKRTCKVCGVSITDVGRVFSKPEADFSRGVMRMKMENVKI